MTDSNELNFHNRAKAMSSFLRVGLHYRRWAEGRPEGVEWSMLNPKRDDKSYGSFKLNTQTGVWSEFSEKVEGADLVDLYAYLKDLSLKDALSDLEAQYGRKASQIETSSRNHLKAKEDSDSEAAEDWAVAPSRCIDFHDREGRVPTFVADYFNREGQLIGHVARYEGKKPGDKDYKPWTWINGHWRCSKGGWKKTPIFGVERLIGNDNPVLIVEGEKCALEAQRVLGENWNVLTWPGGVAKASTADWSILTGNPRVYLWPDDDLDLKCAGYGLRAMSEIRMLIDGGTVLDPHPLNKRNVSGWDIADAIKEGWDRTRLVEFITRPPAQVESRPRPEPIDIPPELQPITSWILKVANEKHELFAVQAAFMLLASLTMGAYETPEFGSVSLYSLVISGASGGKAAYVDKVMALTRKIAPFVLTGEPGSRQALRSDFSIRKCNCLTVYNGELGVGLSRVLVENGIGSQISQDFLECWGNTGFLPGLPTKEGKDPDVIDPFLCLYGGTTMSTFEELLSRKGAVAGGFISRLDPIVSTYIDLDDEGHACADPFPEASMRWLERVANALTSQKHSASNMATADGLIAVKISKVKTVKFSVEAGNLYLEYKKFCRARKTEYQNKNQVLTDIYGRCFEKSARYASLLAIAANPENPEITQAQYEFARWWVERFTSELIGIAFVHGNSSTYARVRAAILRFLAKSMANSATLRDTRNNTLLRNEDVSVVKQVLSSMVDDGLLEQKLAGKSVHLTLTEHGVKEAKI